MSTSFAQNAISMLIDMAQRGEIDPWDVQVIDVFDRFLSELSYQDSQELAASGQAFLYASMLVFLKAETLEPHRGEEELEPDFEQLFLEESDDASALPSPLEGCLQRRPVACPPQRRRVTLTELIHQLELMAVAVDRQSRRPKLRRVKQPSRAQSMQAIAQLAHQENLSEVAEELEALLAELCLDDESWLDLQDILMVKNDPVGVFWALLILCAQSKVELDQSNFYQDLRLRPLTPAPTIKIELPNFKSAAS
jgi:segregation and condensation protein A